MRKRALVVASVPMVGAIRGARAVPQQRPDITVATSDVIVFAKNTMIPMRDGVKLATDIYRPGAGGVPVGDKLPILLQRTPYNDPDSEDPAGSLAIVSRFLRPA